MMPLLPLRHACRLFRHYYAAAADADAAATTRH